MAAGRLSYTFGLKGACLAVDTACSSSLVGAHLGGRDIAAGDADAALAAGVNLTLSPAKTAAFAVTGGLRQPCIVPVDGAALTTSSHEQHFFNNIATCKAV